jgi:hypothetical protein
VEGREVKVDDILSEDDRKKSRKSWLRLLIHPLMQLKNLPSDYCRIFWDQGKKMYLFYCLILTSSTRWWHDIALASCHGVIHPRYLLKLPARWWKEPTAPRQGSITAFIPC